MSLSQMQPFFQPFRTLFTSKRSQKPAFVTHIAATKGRPESNVFKNTHEILLTPLKEHRFTPQQTQPQVPRIPRVVGSEWRITQLEKALTTITEYLSTARLTPDTAQAAQHCSMLHTAILRQQR